MRRFRFYIFPPLALKMLKFYSLFQVSNIREILFKFFFNFQFHSLWKNINIRYKNFLATYLSATCCQQQSKCFRFHSKKLKSKITKGPKHFKTVSHLATMLRNVLATSQQHLSVRINTFLIYLLVTYMVTYFFCVCSALLRPIVTKKYVNETVC